MKMSELYKVQPCQPDVHAHALCSLIQELANFEKLPDGPKLTPDIIADDLRSNHFFAFIASTSDESSKNQQFIGYCLCYYAYSTWEGRFIFLEDLYVKPDYRKSGIGKKLLKCVFQKAFDEKSPRVQWNVLNWNSNAIEYYKRLGAVDLHESEGWIQFRMDQQAIETFCKHK